MTIRICDNNLAHSICTHNLGHTHWPDHGIMVVSTNAQKSLLNSCSGVSSRAGGLDCVLGLNVNPYYVNSSNERYGKSVHLLCLPKPS